MALAKAHELITKANAGTKLNAVERRHAVAFLMATKPEMTTAEMSDLFGVIERQIRFDKQKIREEKSKAISEEDIGLVIADILMSFESTERELYAQMMKSKEGTQVRLNYINAIHSNRLRTVEALQNLGYFPKNLGTQTVNKFEYRASVDMKTGNVDTRRIDEMDYLLDRKSTAQESAIQDAEFVTIPQLPAQGESSAAQQPAEGDSPTRLEVPLQ